MFKKIFLYTIIVISILMIIALSIWLGFPSPEGFDRGPVCFVMYMISMAGIIIPFIFVNEDKL